MRKSHYNIFVNLFCYCVLESVGSIKFGGLWMRNHPKIEECREVWERKARLSGKKSPKERRMQGGLGERKKQRGQVS